MATTVDDVRFTTGLLDLSDAGRYLGVPPATFHRWARGSRQGPPLLHVLPPGSGGRATVPLIAMAEAHVLEALRRAGVRPRKIPPALRQLQKTFGQEYVLAAPNLATDGIDVLWDYSRTDDGAGLIEGRTGQEVIREIVKDYLQYIVRADDGFPAMLRLRSCVPSDVVIDPSRAFGQPIFTATRTRVADVAGMLRAGEDSQVIADELGLDIADVRTAARILLGRAA